MYNTEVYVLTNAYYFFLFLICLLLQESQPRHREQWERLFSLPYTLSLSLSSNHSKDLDAVFFFFFLICVAQTEKNLPAVQETQVQSLSWEDPLEKGMATDSSILA